MLTCCTHVVNQFPPPKTVWCQFGQFLMQNGTAAQVSKWFGQFPRAHSHASGSFCGVRSHIKSPRPLNLKHHKPLGQLNIENLKCPNPEQVWEGSRNKHIKSLKKRKNFIASQFKRLSKEEKELINNLYQEKNRLNAMAGFIKFHVDHIQPLSKGGLHEFNILRIITANENLKKGLKMIG